MTTEKKQNTWKRMLETKSYRDIIKIFRKHFLKHKNFNAVKETSKEYEYANTNTIKNILYDLRIISYTLDNIEFDENRLKDISECVDEYE